MLIKNGNVLYDRKLQAGWDIRLKGEVISAIEPGLEMVPDEPVIDASGCYVLPGLIDLHTHGLKDVYVQDGGWLEFSRLQAEQGVTACLPTLFGSPKVVRGAMLAGLQETGNFERTPNLLGFRLEMPYLTKPGAGQSSALVAIEPQTTQMLWETSRGWIKVWDVSPEKEGALPFIRWAAEQGIVTSLAHSSASVVQVQQAIEAGMKLVTHFYDTFDLAVQTDAGVYPAGLTDYIQIENRLTVEIIPDGVHVHSYLVEKTFRCKGLERIAFITDSVRGAGSPPGIYSGLYPGVEVEVTAGRGVRRVGDDALSGSALTQLQSFRNAVHLSGRTIPEASQLCSQTPAHVLGLSKKGRLDTDMEADLILLDLDMQLRATIIAGKIAYQN